MTVSTEPTVQTLLASGLIIFGAITSRRDTGVACASERKARAVVRALMTNIIVLVIPNVGLAWLSSETARERPANC